MSGSVAAVEVLATSGADVRQIDDVKGRNALHWACKRGHYDLVFHLVSKRGFDPRTPDRDGRTPLMHACWWGNARVAQFLLTGPAGGPHGNSADRLRGWTALIGAARHGHDKVVRMLVLKGLDVALKDVKGRSALLHARCAPVVEALLEANAPYEVFDPLTGRSVLHWACERGDTATVLAVLAHLRDRAKDLDALRAMTATLDTLTGCTPQALAERNGYRAVVSALRGVNFDIYQELERRLGVPLASKRPASLPPKPL